MSEKLQPENPSQKQQIRPENPGLLVSGERFLHSLAGKVKARKSRHLTTDTARYGRKIRLPVTTETARKSCYQ
jgi:hypothetical protein